MSPYRPPYNSARTLSSQKPMDVPPRFIEYGYFVSLFYQAFGPMLGISIGFLGVGLLLLLGAYCVVHLRSPALMFYRPILPAVVCGLSFVAIQVFYHEEPLTEGSTRSFIPWLLTLFITYSLSQRKGFLHRFALAALVLGISLLPFIDFQQSGAVDRAGLAEGIWLANPNDFSAWFGFLCVYFAVLGLGAQRDFVRITSWIVAAGCLFVVALSVSRAPILAVAIAMVACSRRVLKRGFVPVLIVTILLWVSYVLGAFDTLLRYYDERALEETGRLLVWPLAIERYLTSPWVGFGASQYAVSTSLIDPPVTPHNSFLSIGLASGIIPLVFFIGYWWRAGRALFTTNSSPADDGAFKLPLFIYAFLETQVLNFPFMFPWLVVTLSTILASISSGGRHHLLARQRAGALKDEQSRRLRSAPPRRHSTAPR